MKAMEGRLTTRLDHLETSVDTLRHDISDLPAIRQEVRDLDRRVDRLEQNQRLNK